MWVPPLTPSHMFNPTNQRRPQHAFTDILTTEAPVSKNFGEHITPTHFLARVHLLDRQRAPNCYEHIKSPRKLLITGNINYRNHHSNPPSSCFIK